MILLNGYKYSMCTGLNDFLIDENDNIYAYGTKYLNRYFLNNVNRIGRLNGNRIRIDKGDLYREIERKIGMFKTVRRYVSLGGKDLPAEYYQAIRKLFKGIFWCNYGEFGVKEYDLKL